MLRDYENEWEVIIIHIKGLRERGRREDILGKTR